MLLNHVSFDKFLAAYARHRRRLKNLVKLTPHKPRGSGELPSRAPRLGKAALFGTFSRRKSTYFTRFGKAIKLKKKNKSLANIVFDLYKGLVPTPHAKGIEYRQSFYILRETINKSSTSPMQPKI